MSMYDDILIPTDGSDSIEAVLDHTREIASGRDATLHVLYVIDDRAFLTLEESMKDEVVEDLRKEGESAVDAAANRLEPEEVAVETAIAKGKPADEILDYIDSNGVDLVTMGTRAGSKTDNLLGSTAQKLVTNASAPVLTVNVADQ